jgi:hypothetical protein
MSSVTEKFLQLSERNGMCTRLVLIVVGYEAAVSRECAGAGFDSRGGD